MSIQDMLIKNFDKNKFFDIIEKQKGLSIIQINRDKNGK